MNSLKAFFIDFKNSFYGPDFYSARLHKTAFDAAFFLFLTSLLTSFLLIISLFVAVLPPLINFKPAEFVEKNYPQDLSVTIKDGRASTNAELPYIIPIPEDEREQGGAFENIFVIDTRPDVTVETLESYRSAVILTESSLYVQTEDDSRVVPLSEADDVTIDKSLVTKLAEILLKVVWIVVPILALVGAPFISFFGTVYFAIVSIVGAVIPLLIGKMRGLPLTYGEAYKAALYGTVPVMVISTLWMMLGIGEFPMFLDILLFAFFLTLNLKKPKEKPAEVGGLGG